MTILMNTLLIMTFLILVIFINLKMGDITDNGITYLINGFTYNSK
jgi:hypothetical protein